MSAPLITKITSIALSRDSRTLKEACSFSRMGFDCFVVQGEEGDIGERTPFTLQTVTRPHDSPKSSHTSITPNNNASSPPKTAQKKPSKGIKTLLPNWLRYSPRLLRYVWRLLRYNWQLVRTCPRSSLYYIHYFDSFPAVWWLSKRYGVPFIYDAHDCHCRNHPESEMSTYERALFRPFQQWLEGLCISKAAHVVTVGDGLAVLLKEIFGCEATVIRNCQDHRSYRLSGPSLKNLLGLKATDFLLVAIGNAKKGMAIEQVFRALDRLPPHVHLAFVGNSYHSFLKGEEYEKVKSRVHAPGAVKPYEVVPFVADADGAVMLYYPRSDNYKNALPNRFFESLSAGLPLLYPPLHEIAALSTRYQLGLEMNPLDSLSIENAIKQLIGDPSLCMKYRLNSEKAKAELSWEKEETKLMHLLQTYLPQGKLRACAE